MKPRRMGLALAVCAVGALTFGSVAAQAAGLKAEHATGHRHAVPATKSPTAKVYTLCLSGACGTMNVYAKSHTWNTELECWVYEGEECPGLGDFHGTYVKGGTGEISYVVEGPFAEEPEDGLIEVTKVKKSIPAVYKGSWSVFGADEGEATIEP